MKKMVVALTVLVFVTALALVACNTSASRSSGTNSNTVSLAVANFDQTAITIKAGTALTFDDTNGAFHQICLGTNQQCTPSAPGPKDLQGSGFSISQGQTHAVTFDTPGTYQITCSIHANMNLTVTVQ